jgi:hypothetical protein
MADKPTQDTSAAAEDYRIAGARKALAESRQAVHGEIEPAHWWGRMEQVVANLLAVIDEAGQ